MSSNPNFVPAADTIVCPRCKTRDCTTPHGTQLRDDGDTARLECFACGSRLLVTLNVERTFHTILDTKPTEGP